MPRASRPDKVLDVQLEHAKGRPLRLGELDRLRLRAVPPPAGAVADGAHCVAAGQCAAPQRLRELGVDELCAVLRPLAAEAPPLEAGRARGGRCERLGGEDEHPARAALLHLGVEAPPPRQLERLALADVLQRVLARADVAALEAAHVQQELGARQRRDAALRARSGEGCRRLRRRRCGGRLRKRHCGG